MMNAAALAPPDPTSEQAVWRDYRAISGHAVVDPCFIRRMGHAAFLCRLVYNAAIDGRVPFAEGLAYRHRLAQARRSGLTPPDAPTPSDKFLPVPTVYGLGPELTKLCARIPELRTFPRSMLDNALAEACRARAAHATGCATAKADGGRLPKLHHRTADDAWTVGTDDFWLLRIGTDHAQRPPKTRNVTATTRRNRARRAKAKADREAAWAEKRKDRGWRDGRIAGGLARRKARQARDRELQQALQVWTAEERAESRVRRDSPKATVGARWMKADVKGLGRVRLDLGREIPAEAEKVRLTLVKPAWHGAKVEVRLTFTVPERKPDLDPLETGRRLHAVLRHLPGTATRLDAVEAVRAAGIVVRGEDLGVANPSCDDTGAQTPPVLMPRLDVQRMARAQKALSHKDLCRKKADAEAAKAAKAAKAAAKAKSGTVAVDAAAPVDRKVRPRRSGAAERQRAVLSRLGHRAGNRQQTRAHQDASRLMRDAPVLVATDPTRMVPGLVRKGGPAERRALRLALEAGVAPPAKPPAEVISERRQRKMRSNLVATRFSTRIRRVATLAEHAGAIHCTPGHEGTTAGCPACPRVRPKRLGERWHDCPCGLSLPRDQASALETLGRALLPFRLSADPEGRIAQAIAERAEGRAKVLARRGRMAEATRAAALRRRAAREDGRGSPRPPGRGDSGPSTATPKRVRGQGRNVRRSNGQATGVSN